MIKKHAGILAGGAGIAVLLTVLSGWDVPMPVRIAVVVVATLIAWGFLYRGWRTWLAQRSGRRDGGR